MRQVVLLFGKAAFDQLKSSELKESSRVLWEERCEVIAVGPAIDTLPTTENEHVNGAANTEPVCDASAIVFARCKMQILELGPKVGEPEKLLYDSLDESREPTNRKLEGTGLEADQQHTILEPEPEKTSLTKEGDSARIIEVQECLMEVCDSLNEYQQWMVEKFENINTRFDRCDERFWDLTFKHHKLDDKHDGLDEKFENIDTRSDRQDGRIADLWVEHNKHGEELDQIGSKLTLQRKANTHNLAVDRARYENTWRSLRALTNQVSTEHEQREEMQKVIAKMTTDVQNLEDKVDELKAATFQKDYGVSLIREDPVTPVNPVNSVDPVSLVEPVDPVNPVEPVNLEPEPKQPSDKREPETHWPLGKCESEPGDWQYWDEPREDDQAEEQVPDQPQEGRVDSFYAMRNKVKKLWENLPEHMGKKK